MFVPGFSAATKDDDEEQEQEEEVMDMDEHEEACFKALATTVLGVLTGRCKMQKKKNKLSSRKSRIGEEAAPSRRCRVTAHVADGVVAVAGLVMRRVSEGHCDGRDGGPGGAGSLLAPLVTSWHPSPLLGTPAVSWRVKA